MIAVDSRLYCAFPQGHVQSPCFDKITVFYKFIKVKIYLMSSSFSAISTRSRFVLRKRIRFRFSCPMTESTFSFNNHVSFTCVSNAKCHLALFLIIMLKRSMSMKLSYLRACEDIPTFLWREQCYNLIDYLKGNNSVIQCFHICNSIGGLSGPRKYSFGLVWHA